MKINGKEVKENISLSPFTTFKVGGAAKYFFIAENKTDLVLAIKKARGNNIPFFVLGGGSNTLISDQGYEGIVIKLKFSSLIFQDSVVEAEAGLNLKKLVKLTSERGFSGLEWAEGIPGSVGGAIYGNTGAFNVFMKDSIKQVEVLNIETLEIENFSVKQCQFSLKDSIFKKNSSKMIILSAIFKLQKGNKKEIVKKTKKYADYRKRNHPLEYPSAGCIFKNIDYNKIKNDLFPELEKFKDNKFIPAGFLIEKAGLKGKKVGGAQVSEKHANFIINLGNAKSNDILNLVNLIKAEVKSKFGINIKEELQYVGF